MNDLIKERNEIAKQMYWRNPLMNHKNVMSAANALMREMYGEDWERQTTGQKPNEQVEQPPAPTDSTFGYALTIVDHNNEKWVRVQAMGEDFIIAPHDLKDAEGKVMYGRPQPELMNHLEVLGLTTFNRKQGFIIATLIEEINAKLEASGGDKFAEDWYASSELWRPVGSPADCNDKYTWFFDSTNGRFIGNYRCSQFYRSRPVLEYNEKGGKE